MKTYKITLNKSRKTATIRVYEKGMTIAKYRTNRLTSDEMEAMENYTDGDIAAYLRTSGNYRPITVYAFGQPVPEEVLQELIAEDGARCCNTDFIETLYEYDYRDSINL